MLDDLKLLTNEENEQLLNVLLKRAEFIVLSETNRTKVPDKLKSIQLEIAIHLYNKCGSESEVSRSEGGISVTYLTDIPVNLKRVLETFRLARVSGHVFEKEKSEEVLFIQTSNSC